MKARIITQFRSLLNTRQFNTEDRGKSSISNFIITGLLKHSSSRNDKVRRRLKTSLFLSLSLSANTDEHLPDLASRYYYQLPLYLSIIPPRPLL